MKILIGYDGSACSEEAVDSLTQAGLPQTAEAIVVTVADLWATIPDSAEKHGAASSTSRASSKWAPSSSPAAAATLPPPVAKAREHAAREIEQMKEELVHVVDRLKILFPEWTVASDAFADSPYWALIRQARQWGADLVVVGSHGRSKLGRVLLGSVSLNVALHAPCPVRIARAKPGPIKSAARLVLAYDGSPDSAMALEAILSRTWPIGTSVEIISILEPQGLLHAPAYSDTPLYFGEIPSIEAPYCHAWLEMACRNATERLEQHALTTGVRYLGGDPKQLILEEAEKWGADCIFVGARGQRGGKPHELGSVALAVATRAACSVEIVRQKNVSTES